MSKSLFSQVLKRRFNTILKPLHISVYVSGRKGQTKSQSKRRHREKCKYWRADSSVDGQKLMPGCHHLGMCMSVDTMLFMYTAKVHVNTADLFFVAHLQSNSH